MRIFRLSILLAASLALAACGTANRMFDAFGRALHLHAANTSSPEELKLETHDVREALAAGRKIDVTPQDTRPGLAQR